MLQKQHVNLVNYILLIGSYSYLQFSSVNTLFKKISLHELPN